MKKKIHFTNPWNDKVSSKADSIAPAVREKMLNMQQEYIDMALNGNRPPPNHPVEVSTQNKRRQESRPRPVDKRVGKGLR
jgi:hypothetical protein